MSKLKIENVSKTMQGFPYEGGQKWLAPGEFVEGVEISAEQREFLEMRDGLKIYGTLTQAEANGPEAIRVPDGGSVVEKRGPGRPKKDAE